MAWRSDVENSPRIRPLPQPGPDDLPQDHRKMTIAHTERSLGVARRSIAQGIATALVAAFGTGNALAFQLDTSNNPDLSVRWDNTVRVQLRGAGRGARHQDRQLGALRRRRLQLRQGRRGRQAARPAVRVRRRLQEALRRARQRRRPGTTAPTAAPASSNPNPPLVNIPSYIGNQYSSTTKRLYARPVRRTARRLRVRRRRPRRRAGAAPSSAATRSTGASRCSSAATCTASSTRRTRSICRRASRRPAPRPRNCSGR